MTRQLSLVIFLLGTALLLCSQAALADCQEGPTDTFTCDTDQPNPDLTGVQQDTNNNNLTVNMLPGSRINSIVANTPAIGTGDGNDTITLLMAEAIALDDDGIDTGEGNDVVTVTRSNIECDDNCVSVHNGDDVIEVFDSEVISNDNNGLDGGDGTDSITVRDSVVRAIGTGNNFGIRLDDGDDTVILSDSLVQGNNTNFPDSLAIVLGEGDDTLRLETGVTVIGRIDCGNFFEDDPDFGTIVFAMAVPETEIAAVDAAIAAADPDDDSIVINGEFYVWEDCSALVSELSVARPVSIPTLSIAGMAIVAALMVILGLAFLPRVRRS